MKTVLIAAAIVLALLLISMLIDRVWRRLERAVWESDREERIRKRYREGRE